MTNVYQINKILLITEVCIKLARTNIPIKC